MHSLRKTHVFYEQVHTTYTKLYKDLKWQICLRKALKRGLFWLGSDFWNLATNSVVLASPSAPALEQKRSMFPHHSPQFGGKE